MCKKEVENCEDRNMIRSEIIKDSVKYWDDFFCGYEIKAEIPSYRTVPEEERCKTDHFSAELDEKTAEKIAELCIKENAAPEIFVELVWGLVIHTFSRTDDAVFLRVKEVQSFQKTGCFTDIIPVRVKETKEKNARELLRALKKQTEESRNVDCFLSGKTEQRYDFPESIFHCSLVIQSSEDTVSENETDPVSSLRLHDADLKETVLYCRLEEGRFTFTIRFNAEHFCQAEIDRVLRLMTVISKEILR